MNYDAFVIHLYIIHMHTHAFMCIHTPAQPSPVSWLSALTDVCKCFRMRWYENA